MSKCELRSIYIAKDDEYEFGRNLLNQRMEGWDGEQDSELLPMGVVTYFFEDWRDTRLPTDALIAIASENHNLQKLIVCPPENGYTEIKYRKNNKDLVFAATHIQDFFRTQAFTLKNIGEQPFSFPPGHPVSRTFYKQHPLASYCPEKQNYYIPSSMYDLILFAEREAELIGILVDLGATKIRIFKSFEKSSHSNNATSGKLEISAVDVAAKFKSMNASEQESFDNRELELYGSSWHQGDSLDRSKYGWLNFEPEWETIVKARVVGHCKNAEIELFKRSTFHTESEASVKLRKHFAKAEVSTSQVNFGTEFERKLIQVEFGTVLPPKNTGWFAKLTSKVFGTSVS